MKKFILCCAVALLTLTAVGSAMSLKSMMMVGPYAGYTLGFGDAFKDFEGPGYKISTKAGINFGGNFHYGLNDKMMIGGEIYLQRTSVDAEYDAGYSGFDYSDSQTGTNFLFSGLYQLSAMQKAMFLLNAGAGLYDSGSDSDIGLFGGVMYERMLKAKMTLFILARMHFIMATDTVTMLQLAVGLHFWLGKTGSPLS